MPLMMCTVNGQEGMKWGDAGHCYVGPDARQQAIAQGVAMEGQEAVTKYLQQHSEDGVEVSPLAQFMARRQVAGPSMDFASHEGLTPTGKFAKGNTRGTPRKADPKGKPSAEDYREFTPEMRKAMVEKGFALPDGSYPIETKGDLQNAIQAIGRANDRGRVMAHIKKRAHALDAEAMLPAEWR